MGDENHGIHPDSLKDDFGEHTSKSRRSILVVQLFPRNAVDAQHEQPAKARARRKEKHELYQGDCRAISRRGSDEVSDNGVRPKIDAHINEPHVRPCRATSLSENTKCKLLDNIAIAEYNTEDGCNRVDGGERAQDQ